MPDRTTVVLEAHIFNTTENQVGRDERKLLLDKHKKVLLADMTFGEKLFQAREDKGMTQTKLSELSGVDRAAIAKMEAGRQRPYVDQGILLARALRVPLDYLADETLEEAPAVNEDEAFILRTVRAMKLDADEAVRRLSGVERPNVPGPAPDRIPMEVLGGADLTNLGRKRTPR